MTPEQPITTIGKIVEALDHRAYRASLPNGKIIHAHVPRDAGRQNYQVGDQVPLELSPYDFSRARIRPNAN